MELTGIRIKGHSNSYTHQSYKKEGWGQISMLKFFRTPEVFQNSEKRIYSVILKLFFFDPKT